MSTVDEDPRAFLERQRAKLVELEKEAVTRLEQCRQMLRQLDAAIAALGPAGDLAQVGEEPRLTIKQAVLKILGPIAPKGLSALGILEKLRTEFGMNYPRESLSPQLSRLKAEGKLRLDGGIWYSVQTENGPGAKAPEPS